jgi:hypothetical protein
MVVDVSYCQSNAYAFTDKRGRSDARGTRRFGRPGTKKGERIRGGTVWQIRVVE